MEVMELVVVMEVAVAEVEAETCPLLMLSVMAEASTASVGGAVCVSGEQTDGGDAAADAG